MRHFLRIDVLDSGADAGSTEWAEQEGHFIALDKLPSLLHRLWRAVRIIVGDEIDLAAVDATALVDRIDVGDQTLPGIAERRRGTTKRERSPHLHFGARDAGRLRTRLRAGNRHADRGCQYRLFEHPLLPNPATGCVARYSVSSKIFCSWRGFSHSQGLRSARGCGIGRLPCRPFDRHLPQLVFEYLAGGGRGQSVKHDQFRRALVSCWAVYAFRSSALTLVPGRSCTNATTSSLPPTGRPTTADWTTWSCAFSTASTSAG